MKIALVHDYLKEYGGAERVLSVLHEMYPRAPIYTAFKTPGSSADTAFKGTKVVTSWADLLLRYWNFHSTLRFMIPLVWESFDFSGYDVVILSSSGYITKPIRIPKHVKVICYCHTPSRFLYGYETSVEWKKYLVVRIYGTLVAHFLRLYDFLGAKRVNQFVANSKNVAKRIEKFYRKDSVVIYPPVDVETIKGLTFSKGQTLIKEPYFLVASRIVGEKGIPMVMEAANKLGVRLKIVGERAGLQWENKEIAKRESENIEFLGRVSDEELYRLYAGAEALIVLEKDADFGMTPVEAMAAGCPVVAYKAGGYLESVVEGKTGTFFEKYDSDSLARAMKRIQAMKFDPENCIKQASKFSKDRFVTQITRIVNE